MTKPQGKPYKLRNGVTVHIQRDNKTAFPNFLTSQPIKNMLIEKARRIADAASAGFDDDEESYELVVQDFQFDIGLRSTVAVRAKSPKARYIEATDSQLLKALDAARG